MLWLLLILSLTLLYILHKYTFEYWKRRNIPGPKPSFLVGNLGQSFTLKKSAFDVFYEIYKEYHDYPFVGIYKAVTPSLLIRDPDLFKCISVKNFKNFCDNDIYVNKKKDPIVGRNPFFLKGEEWKKTKALLTPCFTSGKMKSIFPILDSIGNKLVKYINQQIDAGESCMESKELCTKTTLENVASCAFGLDAKCFEEPNCEFRQLAHQFLSPGSFQTILFTLALIMPWITKVISLKFVSIEVENKLRKIIQDTIDYREKNNIERLDFLHAMNQLRYTSTDFTMEDVVAQAAGFFGDGYETSSIVLSFLLFDLACNPDAQNKLRNDIQTKIEENNGKLTYEVISDMEYLDACLNETLRKNAIVGALFKICTEKFTYTPTNKKEFKDITVTIEPGTSIIMPWSALFRDPKYFPDPDKFIPERHLKENKEKDLSRGIFKPFGDGPRGCLGQKFGVLQIKVATVHIINNFNLSFNEKTKMPLKFDPTYMLLSPIGGLWINFEKLK